MKVLFVSLLTIIALQANSQEYAADTVKLLSEVVISARRLERFSAGLQVKTFDKEAFEKNPGILLSELLSTQSANFIKTYGAGGLATIGMRGTSAQHTAIYWNGFNINPPNIDMADLSMLPLFLFSRIDMVSGGSSTLFGNGSIGGSLHLNSQSAYKKNNLRLAISMGQYQDRLFAFTSDYTMGKLYLSSSAWYNYGENNFVFANTAKFNNPKERLENADATMLGIIQEAHLPLSARQHLRAGFWLQEREAGIPPSMTMNESQARQHDRMIRGYAQWSLETDKIIYSLKSGYNRDFLNYTNPMIDLNSKIHVGVWTSEAELDFLFSPHTQITSGVNFQLQHARVTAYQGHVNPSQLSLFFLATHEFPSMQWILNAGVRKEFHSDFINVPPALSLGWKGKLANKLTGRLNISSNYRTPTLNDRYWQPGGNPDLLSETSINADAGLDFELAGQTSKVTFSATVYNSRIKNWITWLPTSSNYWRPENIGMVMTYGLESQIKATFSGKKHTQRLEFLYAATRSLYGARSFGDIGNKPQLIYTPVHIASVMYSSEIGQWSMQCFYKFTGSRYTDRANTNQLPPFHTIDLSLVRTVNLSKTRLAINVSVKNITNHAYQVIEYRAMPGRTFNISVLFDLLFVN